MRVFLCMAVFFTSFSLFAIEGSYQLTDWDPHLNKPFSGTAEIKKDKNNVYQAKWDLDTGSGSGTGIMGNNEISFVFLGRSDVSQKSYPGLVTYKINGNTLNGVWILEGKPPLIGAEKLEKKLS